MIKTDKVDAARRQLESAIRMFFGNEDPLAVYTVACAAERILRDVAENSSSSNLHQRLKQMIKPGKEKEFWKRSNQSANFLKHADHDPVGTLEIKDEEIEFTLALVCGYWVSLGHHPSGQIRGFLSWFVAMHPEFIAENSTTQTLLANLNLRLLQSLSRPEQLQWGNDLCELLKKNISNPS
jgi:hypothetical protein